MKSKVEFTDIKHEYTAIDLFVIPRKDDYASNFVTPMKPFEAMCCGLVCVYTPNEAFENIFAGTSNFKASGFDADSLTLAIEAALLERERWHLISKQNRSHMHSYLAKVK